MAKGLRSKSMRKNRSFLRKTLVEPIIEKRQEQLAEKLQKSLDAKQEPTTLLNLKKLLPTTEKNASNENVEDKDDEEMEEEDDEEDEQPKAEKKKSKKVNPFQKPKAVKAAKSNKPQKEMVWFK